MSQARRTPPDDQRRIASEVRTTVIEPGACSRPWRSGRNGRWCVVRFRGATFRRDSCAPEPVPPNPFRPANAAWDCCRRCGELFHSKEANAEAAQKWNEPAELVAWSPVQVK